LVPAGPRWDNYFESIEGGKKVEMGKIILIFLLGFGPLFAVHHYGGGSGHGGHGGCGVPEMDPSLAPSAVALLSGGLLILKSKSGKKGKKD
jgi:hypothetical protein